MSQRTIIALISALFLLGVPALSAQTTGAITGTITDTADQPLVGAQIHLLGTSKGAISRLNGSIHIGNVPAGTYTVAITMIGHDSAHLSLTVKPGDTTVFSVVMDEINVMDSTDMHVDPADTEPRGILAGRIIGEDGEGISGAIAIVVGTSRGGAADIDGNYRIKNVLSGWYQVSFSSDCYEKKVVDSIWIGPNRTTAVTETLAKGECVEHAPYPPDKRLIDPLTTGTIHILRR